jgi:3,4-dihydroxy 2-butanone 4-phosphate synthase/GTP cyclohydrolase II
MSDKKTSTSKKSTPKDLIHEVLSELDKGRPVILSDDADRENEGDLVYLAEKITPRSIAFMMEHGKGLICMSLTVQRMKELGLVYQVQQNESMFGTNFATPFDHISVHDSGIAASSRATSILEASSPAIKGEDFVTPGFVVPVVARPGGVMQRRGQTEGSVDLARLAGASPFGVICEVMDDKGKMLRGKALSHFAKEHALLGCTIEDLVQYRKAQESSIRLVEEKRIPLSSIIRSSILEESKKEPSVTLQVFYDDIDGMEHFSICVGNVREGSPIRIHSECLTGDVFGSLRCDCGAQFDRALAFMIEHGEGVLIYLQQEGRGIGLANKLRAYELQEQGFDTIDANIHLGLPADSRDYRVAAQILKLMKISRVQVLTNNPEKIDALKNFGIKVEGRIPLEIPPKDENLVYLSTKKNRMGHILSIRDRSD